MTRLATKKTRKVLTKKTHSMGGYGGPKAKDVPVESKLFEGLLFCKCVTASPPIDADSMPGVKQNLRSRDGLAEKHEIERLILAHGGTRLQLPNGSPQMFIVFDGPTNYRRASMLLVFRYTLADL